MSTVRAFYRTVPVRTMTTQSLAAALPPHELEAQREAVTRFAASEGFDLAAEFMEVETGKGQTPRPKASTGGSVGRRTRQEVPRRISRSTVSNEWQLLGE
jgi:hypothetical protein